MENLEDPKVIKWLKDQENYTKGFLEKIPNRSHLIEKQKSYDAKEKFKISYVNITNNGKCFFIKQMPDEDKGNLYYRSDYKSNDILLLKSDSYKKDNVINYIKPDWEGNQIAIGLASPNEEISEIIVIDVKSREITSKVTMNAAPSMLNGINWLPDNSGIMYQYLPSYKINDKTYLQNTRSTLYRINGDSKVLLSKANNPELNINEEDFPFVHFRNRHDSYIFGTISGVTSYHDTYIAKSAEINSKNLNWKLLFKKEEKISKFLLDGEELIYLTSKNASNFKICKVNISNPDFDNPITIISEKKDKVITNFELTSEGFFYTTIKNGIEVALNKYENNIDKAIKLPMVSGRISIISPEKDSENLYISLSGWASPEQYFLYDSSSDSFKNMNLSSSDLHKDFENIAVEEIEVKSHDGSLVPLSLIYNKNLKLKGDNYTLLTGYGSYGISLSPYFSSSLLTWVTEGGVLAVAHVRGGGEKGESWYREGHKTKKQNTWKDAIACAEFLIDKGYTTKGKLGMIGSSAAGILIGRSITERPDLFKVAIANVPSMNLIRSEIQPNGPNSIKEFGTVKDSIEFKALLAMDSYHNIKQDVCYPATLITAGMKDSRVVAWDPAKFAAALQEANKSDNPILFQVDFEIGHSVMQNKEKRYSKHADFFSFAFWKMGHPDYQPE